MTTALDDILALKIWRDGAIVDPAQAVISVWDHGLLYGDGVFEGIRLRSGRLYRPQLHLARLRGSARAVALEIPYSDDALLARDRADGARERHRRGARARRGDARRRVPRDRPAPVPDRDHADPRLPVPAAARERPDQPDHVRRRAQVAAVGVGAREVAQLPRQRPREGAGERVRRRRRADARRHRPGRGGDRRERLLHPRHARCARRPRSRRWPGSRAARSSSSRRASASSRSSSSSSRATCTPRTRSFLTGTGAGIVPVASIDGRHAAGRAGPVHGGARRGVPADVDRSRLHRRPRRPRLTPISQPGVVAAASSRRPAGPRGRTPSPDRARRPRRAPRARAPAARGDPLRPCRSSRRRVIPAVRRGRNAPERGPRSGRAVNRIRRSRL